MTNPYANRLDDYHFWSKAMTTPAPGQIDPVVRAAQIEPHHKVATMGSCFAQHLARHIADAGLNYFVTEKAPESMDADTARNHGYGVYSARYGNVYTVRQALQLFDRAFGFFQPKEDVWEKNKRFVDAFRPHVEPHGYATADEVRAASVQHLNYVREVFTEADWLVFTLGLTEAWRSKADGAIYPTAPGVAGGSYDPEKYEFVNFTASEVASDLKMLVEKIKSINPKVKILLTVSPVSLIATYEKRHVWVSTTFSKAALRVAADEVERAYSDVIYFPSYEIITSPAAGGRYYADDLRQVTDLGVKHVMRMFQRHFIGRNSEVPAASQQFGGSSVGMNTSVMCDEEAIEKSLRDSKLL